MRFVGDGLCTPVRAGVMVDAADGASETGGNGLDDISGRVAVVTGGAAGIGRGIIAEALLGQGCVVSSTESVEAHARGAGSLPVAVLS